MTNMNTTEPDIPMQIWDEIRRCTDFKGHHPCLWKSNDQLIALCMCNVQIHGQNDSRFCYDNAMHS